MPKIITRAFLFGVLCLVLGGVLPTAAGKTELSEPPTFTFYPQAGILWQDLYFSNFVDLDPGPGTLDWSCGSQTYDGHTGEDSIIRSFREQRIGVPVFAALDGVVIDVSDRLPDEHTERSMTVVDNHVIISSLGRQVRTIYGHLRRDVPVRVGQRVVAGQQLGWTASSGHSSWPHLHLTGKLGLKVYEPFAGPCRPGRSYWRSQPALPSAPYARDFTFSRKRFGGRRDPPWDEAVRTGTFAAGRRDVYFRAELAFFDGGPVRVTVLRPDGSVALDAERDTHLRGYLATWASWHERLELDQTGRWRLRLAAAGRRLVDAPFRVVASGPGRNRAPHSVSVAIDPSAPTPEEVLQCFVRASLVTEDPDYDIVRYRYRWRVGGRVVRRVTSAALSDVLRHRLAHRGQSVSCAVTPSDGKRAGPTAAARVSVG
jgi:Peptidase family M23